MGLQSRKRPRLLSQYGSNPYARALFGTARLIGTAAPTAYNIGKKIYSMTRTKTKNTGVDAPIMSTQHDQITRYRRKRMPRGKRKRWVSFTRKVRHVDLQMQPLQIYTKEGTINLTSAANQSQIWSRMAGGTTVTNNDELFRIFAAQFNTAVLANMVDYRIFVKSLAMDIQLTNNGTTTLIVDVYTLRCRKTFASATDVAGQYNAALTEVAAAPNAGTLSVNGTATTVFDAPNFCEFWQTMRKREVLIGAGVTSTFQIRLPVNKMIEGKVLQSNLQAIPFYTKAMLFDWHGPPNNQGAAGAAQFAPTSVTFGYQTVVHYAVVPGTNTKSAGSSQ